MKFNWDFLKPLLSGWVTNLLAAAGAYLGLTGEDRTKFIGAGLVIASFVWEWWKSRGAEQTIALLKKVTQQTGARAAIAVAKAAPSPAPVAAAPAATTVVKALLVAFALSASLLLVLTSGSAQALPLRKARPAAAAATVDPLQKLMDDIAAKTQKDVAGVIDALQEADTDAATLTNPSDPTSFRDAISHACYPAQIRFLQSLPAVQPIKAPAPYNLIVLFQRKRDLIAQIKAGLPGYLKVGCAALLQDEKNIFFQTIGLIGVQVGAGVLTGLFPPAAPLTLPALTFPALSAIAAGG